MVSEMPEKARKVLERLKAGVGKLEEINVLCIGAPGVGKSSLINSCVMALTHNEYKQFALVGVKRNEGDTSITQHVRKYDITTELPGYKEEPYKTRFCFYDTAGLPNANDKTNLTFLDLLLSGKMQEGTAYSNFSKLTKEQIEKGFQDFTAKINIACFVHAYGEGADLNLATAIGQAALNSKREMPVFLIITKMDKNNIDKNEEEERQHWIQERLALVGVSERVFRFTLYCEDAGLKRNEEKDNELHDLWLQLTEPVYCDRQTEFPQIEPESNCSIM